MDLKKWSKFLREKATTGSSVVLSYPLACLIATELETADKLIDRLEKELDEQRGGTPF